MQRQFSEYDQQVHLRLFPWVNSFLMEKGYFIDGKIVTEKNIVGMYLLALIGDAKPAYDYNSKHMEHEALVNVSLFLPKRTVYQTNSTICKQKEHEFNKFCERLLKEELYAKLDFSRIYTAKEIKVLIYDFLDTYNIVDGPLNYESLQKAYYREKKEREKFFPNLSVA